MRLRLSSSLPWLGGLFLTAGCLEFSTLGATCSATSECSAGLVCADHVCRAATLDGGEAGDAGAPPDAGIIADAGAPDSGTPDGGRSDAGSPPDAGADAGSGFDGGARPDAGSAPDAGTGVDAGPPLRSVGGVIFGLDGASVELTSAAGAVQTVAGSGVTTPFSFQVSPTAPYDIEVRSSPPGKLCLAYRNTGPAGTASVSNVYVGCSTSDGLVATLALEIDGGLTGAFTLMSGTPLLGPDRFGRANSALAGPGDGGAGYQLRFVQALNGVPGGPPDSGYTVSAWVLVPASAAATINGILGYVDFAASDSAVSLASVHEPDGGFYFNHYVYLGGAGGNDVTRHTYPAPVLGPASSVDAWSQVVIAGTGAGGANGRGLRRDLYVNGALEASSETCCSWSQNSKYWVLSEGLVWRDDVRVFRRPLTAAEVQALYQSETPP